MLIQCDNCNKTVSDKAISCIHCGSKINVDNLKKTFESDNENNSSNFFNKALKKGSYKAFIIVFGIVFVASFLNTTAFGQIESFYLSRSVPFSFITAALLAFIYKSIFASENQSVKIISSSILVLAILCSFYITLSSNLIIDFTFYFGDSIHGEAANDAYFGAYYVVASQVISLVPAILISLAYWRDN